MAKKKAGEMPKNMINKGVAEVKSTGEIKKEIMDNIENKSMIEMASEQENEITTTIDEHNEETNSEEINEEEVNNEEVSNEEINNKENNNTKTEESSKYISSVNTSKAFEKVLSKRAKKPKKEKTMIYLEEDVMKQFKTLARTYEVSVTKLFEIACMDYIKGQEIDEILVAEYDAINKRKGRRKNNEDKSE